jgi:hypothetical protein
MQVILLLHEETYSHMLAGSWKLQETAAGAQLAFRHHPEPQQQQQQSSIQQQRICSW